MSTTFNTQALSTSTKIALSQASNVAQVDRITGMDITAVVAGSNPSNITFVDGDVTVGSDLIAETSHGFTTGAKVTELTTTGVLPAGLALSTVYYIIATSANTFKLASSQANALAGTAVDITAAAGGGTHTVVIATTLAGTIKLQKNNNPPTLIGDGPAAVWVDLHDDDIQGGTNSNTISAAATFNWNVVNFNAREIRALVTITSGTVTVDMRLHGKGP